MSANQVPGPARERDTSIHSCSRCWMNGGEGHGLFTPTVRRTPAAAAWARRTLATATK